MRVPREYELCAPTLKALQSLGGTSSIQDIALQVIYLSQLPDDLVCQLHGNGPQTELEYRLAWARTVLRTIGFIYNPKRGVWALSERGSHQSLIDSQKIRRTYLDLRSEKVGFSPPSVMESNQPDLSEDEFWRRLTTEQFFMGYDEADLVYDPA